MYLIILLFQLITGQLKRHSWDLSLLSQRMVIPYILYWKYPRQVRVDTLLAPISSCNVLQIWWCSWCRVTPFSELSTTYITLNSCTSVSINTSTASSTLLSRCATRYLGIEAGSSLIHARSKTASMESTSKIADVIEPDSGPPPEFVKKV